MDFSHLQSLQHELNSTDTTAYNLPSTLLELVVPGYSTISQLAFRLLGIDIGAIVTGWAVLFAGHKAWVYLCGLLKGYFDEYWSSSIYIDDHNSLFGEVKAWLAEEQKKRPSRKLMAVRDDQCTEKDANAYDEQGMYKHKNPMPKYEPTYGSERFFHGGRRFKVVRSSIKNKVGSCVKETIEIYCYARTAQPIKDLLAHIRQWKTSQDTAMTRIYRALGDGGHYWSGKTCRPSRPLSTVSLDQKQKDDLVEDINEYLHPATARWYAARGIPHRRGYLFHGPPGTGKTSLSFALAGIFGLKIYCLALNDKELTESDLCSLFESLPDRCIVLLEDIDSAGLKREEEHVAKESSEAGDSDTGSSKKTVKCAATTESGSGSISLSALLNVIDGAASHEGHVLIMTSNTPEKLDAALIRPGRVDLQVAFALATPNQTYETFMRMYTPTADEQAAGLCLPLRKSRAVSEITDSKILQEMAQRFSAQLPGGTFTPAEIQGYLLLRKKRPQKALDDLQNWIDEMLEVKKKGKRLVGA